MTPLNKTDFLNILGASAGIIGAAAFQGDNDAAALLIHLLVADNPLNRNSQTYQVLTANLLAKNLISQNIYDALMQ